LGVTTRSRARVVRLPRLQAPEDDVKLRLARELHDQVVQDLVVLIVELENFKREQLGRASVLTAIGSLQDTSRRILRNVREMLLDLRGEAQFGADLVAMLEGDLLPRFERQTGLTASLTVSERWPAAIGGWAAFNVYRVIQEGLANVRLHSGATHVALSLELTEPGTATITLLDDGVGLRVDDGLPAGAGLVGMKERAVILGGTLTVDSRSGGGTELRLEFAAQRLL